MAFNPNVHGVKKDVKDSPFLTLSKRNKEGLSSENINSSHQTQGTKGIDSKNIFGQNEAQGVNSDVQMFAQEEKGAEEYIQEDEQGNVSFDEAGFYDDAWGINLGNSTGSTNPIKTSASKQDNAELKTNLTNLIKTGKTKTEVESAKDELKAQGVSTAEISTIEETAQKNATKTATATNSASTATPSLSKTATATNNASTATSNLSEVDALLGFSAADTNAIKEYAINNPGKSASTTANAASAEQKTESMGQKFLTGAKDVAVNGVTGGCTNLVSEGTVNGLKWAWEGAKDMAGFGGDADVKEAEKALETEKEKLEDLNSDKEKAMKDNSAAKEYEEAKAEYDSAKATNEEETTKEKEWNTNKEKADNDLTTATTEQTNAQSHYDQCVLDERSAQLAVDNFVPTKDKDGNETAASKQKKAQLDNALKTAQNNKKLAKEELEKKDKAKETAQTEADKYKGENPHTNPKNESANKMKTAEAKMNSAKTEANKVKSGTTDTIDKLNANITKQKAAVSKAEKSLTAAKKKAEENKKKEEKK